MCSRFKATFVCVFRFCAECVRVIVFMTMHVLVELWRCAQKDPQKPEVIQVVRNKLRG